MKTFISGGSLILSLKLGFAILGLFILCSALFVDAQSAKESGFGLDTNEFPKLCTNGNLENPKAY